jgi:hypothetical protein
LLLAACAKKFFVLVDAGLRSDESRDGRLNLFAKLCHSDRFARTLLAFCVEASREEEVLRVVADGIAGLIHAVPSDDAAGKIGLVSQVMGLAVLFLLKAPLAPEGVLPVIRDALASAERSELCDAGDAEGSRAQPSRPSLLLPNSDEVLDPDGETGQVLGEPVRVDGENPTHSALAVTTNTGLGEVTEDDVAIPNGAEGAVGVPSDSGGVASGAPNQGVPSDQSLHRGLAPLWRAVASLEFFGEVSGSREIGWTPATESTTVNGSPGCNALPPVTHAGRGAVMANGPGPP